MLSYSPLTSESFLRLVWTEDLVPVKDDSDKSALSRRTVTAIAEVLLGAYYCEACAFNNQHTYDSLEGHHHNIKHMKVSEYRHCIKRKFRQRQILKVYNEIKNHIIFLCKMHHEDMHHAQTK